MDPRLLRFVEFLRRNRIRATYKAVGDAAEVPHRSVGGLLGEKCPLASWVVSDRTGEPTGYAAHQKDPDLYRSSEIIRTGDELIRRMKREPRPSEAMPITPPGAAISPESTQRRPDRQEVIDHCLERSVHVLGEIVMAFGNLELMVATAIWQMLALKQEGGLQLAQAATAAMSFRARVDAFSSMYRLVRPDDDDGSELKAVVSGLFRAEEIRNILVHSAWSDFGVPAPDLTRIKSQRKGHHHRIADMSYADLEELLATIAEVGNRFARFVSENLNT